MDDVHDRAPARKAEIVIPKRSRGRQSVAAQLAYREQVEEFCRRIEEIRATLDFEVSARGWCYILEEHGATKADFTTIERLFVACRKSGDLPIDICAEDEARAAEHVEDLDEADPGRIRPGLDRLRPRSRSSPVQSGEPLGRQRLLLRDVGREDRPEVPLLRHLQALHDPADQYPRTNVSQQPRWHDAAIPRARERGQDLRPALLRRPRPQRPGHLRFGHLRHREPVGRDRLLPGRSDRRSVRAELRFHRGRGLELVGQLGDLVRRGLGQSEAPRPLQALRPGLLGPVRRAEGRGERPSRTPRGGAAPLPRSGPPISSPTAVLADFEARRAEAQIEARSEILQLLAAS